MRGVVCIELDYSGDEVGYDDHTFWLHITKVILTALHNNITARLV